MARPRESGQSSGANPKRQVRMKPAERRQSILAAATRAFLRSGFSGTSMDEVAAEAGVTRLIVYLHFASKQDLYDAVLEHAARSLAACLGEATTEHQDDPIRVVVTGCLRDLETDPDGARLLLTRASHELPENPHLRDVRRKALELVASSASVAGAAEPERGRLSEVVLAAIEACVLAWNDAASEPGASSRIASAISSLAETLSATRD